MFTKNELFDMIVIEIREGKISEKERFHMRNKKAFSIKDVATRAGVSTATVSRVMNQKGGYSKETEQRVLNIIKDGSYKLSEKIREKIVGVLIQDITNEWFASVAAELEEQLYKKGYATCIYTTSESIQKTEWYFEECMRRRFAGVIIVSPTQIIAQKAKDANIPIIFIDRTPVRKEGIVSVEFDHYLGGYMATEYLIRKGCNNIMFLGREEHNPAVGARLHGYLDAIEDYHLPQSEKLIITLNDNYNLYDTAYHLTYYLLKKSLFFDGIFCTNDIRAFGALQALQQNNIKVPEEVKVIGYDDISLAKQCYPALTTIRQNTEELAVNTVELLMKLLMKPDTVNNRNIILPVSLVERGTA